MNNRDPVIPRSERRVPVEFGSIALKGLFIIGSFYTVYFARDLLIPFVLALLLNFLLRPVIRVLTRLKIPIVLSAALVVIALVGGIGYGIVKLAKPAAEWVDKLPGSLREIDTKVGILRKPVEGVNKAVQELKKITNLGGETKLEVEIRTPGIPDTVLTETQAVVVKGSVMFILLYFLLASGDLFLQKFIKLYPRLGEKKEVVKITRDLEHQISRYLYVVTLVNFCLGLSVGLGMYVIGMPSPFLWGAMAGSLVFLPYFGPLIGICVVTIVAFLTFENLGTILLVPALYIALETIQGQVISPMVLGSRFELNPVMIFVWLIFWGWMWGIIGALLAFPMLMVFRIFCDHIPSLAPVGEFLGR